MKCREARRLFSDRVDGILPADAQEAFDRHIAECTGCRSGFEQVSTLEARVKALPVPPLPAGYWEQYLESFRKRLEGPLSGTDEAFKPRRTVFRRFRAWQWAAAALLLVCGTVLIAVMNSRDSAEPATAAVPAAPAAAAETRDYYSTMTRATIACSQSRDLLDKAGKLLEMMDVQITKMGQMARDGRSDYVDQFARSYCTVIEGGFRRLMLMARKENVDIKAVRELFTAAGQRHEQALLGILEERPESDTSIRRALAICRSFQMEV